MLARRNGTHRVLIEVAQLLCQRSIVSFGGEEEHDCGRGVA